MRISKTSIIVLLLLFTLPLVFTNCGGKEEKNEPMMEIVTTSQGGASTQTGGAGAVTGNPAIFKVFSDYKKALLDADGSSAAKLVCSKTLDWYADALKEALSLDRKEFDQRDIMKKFFIVRLRHEFPKKEAEQMTGNDLFVIGVKKGWVGSASIQNTTLDRVEENGDTAVGYIAAAPGTPAFFFAIENGEWKVSLVGSFPLAIKTLKHYADSSGMSENEWIIKTINSLSEQKVDPKILDEYI